MKPAASLSASLLARKGFAAPSAPLPFQPATPQTLRPVVRPAEAAKKTGAARAKSGAAKSQRVALTLRLDPDRHLQLRLLAAHNHMTAQDLLTTALDQYLQDHLCGDLKHCACLAGAGDGPCK